MRAPLHRREFLASLARVAAGTIALGALPPWTRAALAAAPPDLIERNESPEHWETTPAALGRTYLTPNDLFFVRSHFPAPQIDLADWRLRVEGHVTTPLALTLTELQALPPVEAPYTLECAGNGRGLMPLPNTSGTQWAYGAVGTAMWKGVRLSDVLARAGVKPTAKHVWLEAADEAPLLNVPRFLRSLPIEVAASGFPMLAYGMNGTRLPALHGAPLRLVTPGWFGMASTKWLTRIRLEEGPSDNYFMTTGYRYNRPGETPAQAAPVGGLRVKSLITSPVDGARVRRGTLAISGFAWAGFAGVSSVQVSADGGDHWALARVDNAPPLSWREFAISLPVAKPGLVTLMARASDGAGQTQPLTPEINAGGYGNHAVHRVTVDVRA